MTLKNTLKKIFGCKAKVGDEVAGYLDWSYQYEGTVKEDHSNAAGFPHYIVQGKTIVSPMFGNDIVKEKERIIVPAPRINLK